MIHYSFIIPHRNMPDLLVRCLNSIPHRDDIEVIVVDDNSDEDKRDFSNSGWWNDHKATFLFTQEGLGAGYARNQGLKLAHGKWILFADADDYYTDGFINVLDNYAPSDCYEVIYYRWFEIKGGKKNVFDINYPDRGTPIDVGLTYFTPWNKMMQRSFIERYGIRFQQTRVANDVRFSVQTAIHQSSIKVIEDALYCRELRPNSLSTAKNYCFLRSRVEVYLQCNSLLKCTGFGSKIIPLFGFVLYARKYGKSIEMLRLIYKSDTPLFHGIWRQLLHRTSQILQRKNKRKLNY